MPNRIKQAPMEPRSCPQLLQPQRLPLRRRVPILLVLFVALASWTGTADGVLIQHGANVDPSSSNEQGGALQPPLTRRRALQGNPTTTNAAASDLAPLIRVWVSYQPGVSHDDGVTAIQTSLLTGLKLTVVVDDNNNNNNNVTNSSSSITNVTIVIANGTDANVTTAAGTVDFGALMVPDQDQDPLTRRRRARHLQETPQDVVANNFRVHYDFFDSGISSIAMSVTPDVLMALKTDPTVRKIKRDPRRKPLSPVDVKEDEPLLRRHRQLDTIPYGITMVNAPGAWKKGYRGKGVTVCVMDTGIDTKHPEYVNQGITGVSSGAAGSWSTDGFGHGTHVTGTLAARNNKLGVVGVAPMAKIVTVKVFDSNGNWVYASSVGNAALQCQKMGAKVISMSLGGTGSSQQENGIFASLLRQGVVSVAAAANSGTTTYYYPASYASVVSVAAIDSSKKVASFSQKNNRVDVAAPGVSVYSTLPVKRSYLGSNYGTLSGTSMATPHVSGVAALLFSKNMTKSGPEIVSALTSTAVDLGKSGYDTSYGYGLVSATAALAKI